MLSHSWLQILPWDWFSDFKLSTHKEGLEVVQHIGKVEGGQQTEISTVTPQLHVRTWALDWCVASTITELKLAVMILFNRIYNSVRRLRSEVEAVFKTTYKLTAIYEKCWKKIPSKHWASLFSSEKLFKCLHGSVCRGHHYPCTEVVCRWIWFLFLSNVNEIKEVISNFSYNRVWRACTC